MDSSAIRAIRDPLAQAVAAAAAQVRTFETALAQARSKFELAKAKLEGFDEAIAAASTASPAVPTADSNNSEASTAEQPSQPAQARTRMRSLTGHWQRIMQTVAGVDFSYNDLMSAASLVGHTVGKEALRSQMSGYKKAGIVESAGDGLFRITPYGMKAAGISDVTEHDSEKGEAGALPVDRKSGKLAENVLLIANELFG